MTFPEIQGQVQTLANQGREGMQGQGRSREGNSAALGLVPPRGTHATSSSRLAGTEAPSGGEVLPVCCPHLVDANQLEPEGWWCRLPITSPPTNQKTVCELIKPHSLNTVTPHYTLQGGSEGISPLWPSWPVKELKLFSISPKTRSLRFTLVLGYRGLIWLQGLLSNIIVNMSASTAQSWYWNIHSPSISFLTEMGVLLALGKGRGSSANSSPAQLRGCLHDTVSDFLKSELSPRTRWKPQWFLCPNLISDTPSFLQGLLGFTGQLYSAGQPK